MSLKTQLNDDVKTALRAGDKPRVGVLRMALAAIKQREVDERIELDEAQVLATLEKMIKQRRESAAQYERGNREDLAARELAEIELLAAYLPAPLSETELEALIEAAVSESGATSVRDMGKVMGLVKQRAAGRADMGQVSQRVKARLTA